MVRPTDEEPPPEVRAERIATRLQSEGIDYRVSVLEADISSVNYGRGVGYEVNHWEPPEDIAEVSSTALLGRS